MDWCFVSACVYVPMSTSSSENTDLQPAWWKKFAAQITKKATMGSVFFFLFFFLLAFPIYKEILQSIQVHLYKPRLARKGQVRSNAVSWCLTLVSFKMIICNILDCTNTGCFTQGHTAGSLPQKQVLELKEITKPTFLPSGRCAFRGHRWREMLEVSTLSVSPCAGLFVNTT